MKFSPYLAICLGVAGSLAATCQVATPSVGYVRYLNGEVRPVYGLEGNYIVSDSVVASAEAVGFSSGGGLSFQAGRLALIDTDLTTVAAANVGGSATLLRVDKTLETAIAWLPGSRALVHWNGKSLASISIASVTEDDTVVSVRKLDSNTASLLVSKPDTTVARYVISLRTAELKSAMPVPAACRAAWDDGVRILCASDEQLSVLAPTGETVQTLQLPTKSSIVIEQASARCLHLSGKAPGEDWLLHLDDKILQLYQLPGLKTKPASTDGAKSKSAQ